MGGSTAEQQSRFGRAVFSVLKASHTRGATPMMPQSWLMTGSRKKGATLGSQDLHGASTELASLTILLLARSLCFVGRLRGPSLWVLLAGPFPRAGPPCGSTPRGGSTPHGGSTPRGDTCFRCGLESSWWVRVIAAGQDLSPRWGLRPRGRVKSPWRIDSSWRFKFSWRVRVFATGRFLAARRVEFS